MYIIKGEWNEPWPTQSVKLNSITLFHLILHKKSGGTCTVQLQYMYGRLTRNNTEIDILFSYESMYLYFRTLKYFRTKVLFVFRSFGGGVGFRARVFARTFLYMFLVTSTFFTWLFSNYVEDYLTYCKVRIVAADSSVKNRQKPRDDLSSRLAPTCKKG